MTTTQGTHEAPVELQWTPCEICGSDERVRVVSRTDLFLGGDTLYHMAECCGCGVVYQHPRPAVEAMGRFYPPNYQQYTRSLRAETWLRRLDRRYGLRKRCQVVTRHVKSGRLLDVGCATGDFLSEMKRQPGWDVVGIEPSKSAATYARQNAGVEVVEAFLNAAPFASQVFDAITMWDVLEHVYDPLVVIHEAARLLRSGGVLVVNHPNLESIDRRLFGRFWLGYELPRHLYLFPTQLLRCIMSKYGLQELERRCLYGSHAATSTSIAFIAEAYLGVGQTTRMLRQTLSSKPCRAVLFPYFYAIDRLRRGSNVTVVFRKLQ